MRAQGSNRLSHGIADCSIPVLEAYPKFETAGYGEALWIASGPTSWGKNLFLTAVCLLTPRSIGAVVLFVETLSPVDHLT